MRYVPLIRIDGYQVVRIPREFELPGSEAIICKDGERLIIEPVARRRDLREVLPTLRPLTEDFPDIEDAPAADEEIF